MRTKDLEFLSSWALVDHLLTGNLRNMYRNVNFGSTSGTLIEVDDKRNENKASDIQFPISASSVDLLAPLD